LQPSEGSHRRKRRVGRGHGSGRGKTAGRGTKGQNARTGGGWNPRFEGGQTPVHLRLPHRRGFKNPFRVEYEVVKLSALDRFEAGARVNRAALEGAGLLRRNDPRPIKLLANGEVTKALHFDGVHCSRAARAKVEAVGGSFAGVDLPSLEGEAAVAPEEPVALADETDASES
jgi:large subunit ribosomal protein L15